MKHTKLLVAAFAAALITGAQASIVTGLTFSGNGSVSGAISGSSLD